MKPNDRMDSGCIEGGLFFCDSTQDPVILIEPSP